MEGSQAAVDVTALKQAHRKVWASGDFDRIAELILPVGRRVVERAGVSEGMEVLDVGAGTGNAAVPAAQAGAHVIASDLTPELFEAGRRRAEAAGVQIEWEQADAEDLPYEDGRFDAVLSTFGAMFAPTQDAAAAELARVCKPGGTIAMANWTPEGSVGDFFRLVGRHNPPPVNLPPPILWGDPDHVRRLLEPHGITVECEREIVGQEAESPEAYVELFERFFGPVVMAKAALEPQGKWEAFKSDYLDLVRSENKADDGRFRLDAEYLLVLGRKSA